nr:MAG TPA: hypothetical protein [Caudoviricetes sp.]
MNDRRALITGPALNILSFYFDYPERRIIISEISQSRISHKQSKVLVDMA